MSDLSPALIEELVKALDDTYEESGGMATSAECIRDLVPILSRALAETWTEGRASIAEFIAAADPETVLALIAEIQRLRAGVQS